MAAIKCGSNPEIIRFLLENGADPTIPPEFPAIYWAIKLGAEGTVRLFSEYGVTPVSKEVAEERFASLHLDQILQEDTERRNAVS